MNNYTEFTIGKIGDICKIEVLSHLAAAPLTIKFKEVIDELIQKEKCKKILFDLSKVEFVDSSFIGAIVYAHKILSKSGGKVSCVVTNASVNDRFMISQLDRLFTIHKNFEDALSDLQN
jgi:anti-anti-sigma factor